MDTRGHDYDPRGKGEKQSLKEKVGLYEEIKITREDVYMEIKETLGSIDSPKIY